MVALRRVADSYELPLFMDGARLAMALAAADVTGLSPTDYVKYVDLFYVGGTKCGALFGESLIVSNKIDQTGFRTVQTESGQIGKGSTPRSAIPRIIY